MSNVCHIIRKSSQFGSSFIRNQITNHRNYSPHLVYRLNHPKLFDSDYNEVINKTSVLDLNDNSGVMEDLLYSGPKILSQRQIVRVNSFIQNKGIKIAHFHYGTDCGAFYPLIEKLNIPAVVSFYGYDISSFPRFLFGFGKRYLQKRVFSKIDKVLAMSPDMRNDLIDAGCPPEKIIVHYYGTDCRKFYHKHNYPEDDEIRILTLSNMCEKKGHIFQFEALKKLLDEGISNFRFHVLGSGNLEQKLKTFVLEHGLKDHVFFLGPVKYGSDQMMREFKNADIFLHPSVIAPNGDKEGIPGTIVEAMASGLPVVSTYHAGIPYIIKNMETGILVEEWDVQALAEAIKKLILSRDLREKTGKNAQYFAINNLELTTKEIELESIYDSLISIQ